VQSPWDDPESDERIEPDQCCEHRGEEEPVANASDRHGVKLDHTVSSATEST
jgi:hypothetical protein